MAVLGFVGLGAMGSRMAARLLDAGHDVLVWNRTAAKARPLAERGATVAATPREAAAVDAVFTMLADPAALRAVTDGPDGIAAGVGGATGEPTVIEMSTVGPEAVSWLASRLPAGAGLLDAPVLGSLDAAESGTLRIFVGGPEPLVQRWTPVLTALGEPTRVGPLGSGAAAKIVANSTLFGSLGILGEALALARGLGLSDDAAYAALAGTPVAAQAERRRPAIESGAYPHRFTLALARKDVDLVLAAAAAAGVDLRIAAAARTWLADAEAAGRADQDYAAVITQIINHP